MGHCSKRDVVPPCNVDTNTGQVHVGDIVNTGSTWDSFLAQLLKHLDDKDLLSPDAFWFLWSQIRL